MNSGHQQSFSLKEALEKVSQNEMRIEEFFRLATEEITRNVGSTRASIWIFNSVGDRITCLDLFDTRKNAHSSGTVLEQDDFPEYFEAITKNAVVRAPFADRHPDTACFQELYFEPNDIRSLLDFIISSKTRATGVMCCEHCGEYNEWTDEHVKYLEQVAFSISFAISIAQKQSA